MTGEKERVVFVGGGKEKESTTDHFLDFRQDPLDRRVRRVEGGSIRHLAQVNERREERTKWRFSRTR
jgi:hypothetical protein